MKYIGLNELRDLFREFYVSKGHFARESFSLVPSGDKSLLLINSGMAPLKPYFAGLETPPAKRMTTCQKCLRTGDLENVGHTARHGTFFEMLGSFSFGDYFKKESLVWGWEFCTKILELPVDKLWASIYEEDDEAYDIWVNDVGISPDRVVRMGKEDNFWEIGTGPCGPCSEIYFDRGEKYGCDSADCKPGCECDRYVEFWNHVFTQFNRDDDGNYTPLEHPNIDTGMGLERVACIMQNTDSIFDVDTIRAILEEVTRISGVKYMSGEAETDISIRIITDHIRSVTFLISDGVIPSNEGRGYVLRRLLRRAVVHGRKLGVKGTFLMSLADKVIEVSGKEYKEIAENSESVKKIIRVEEARFAVTIDQGYELLNGYIEKLRASGKTILPGNVVFKLYDTHGFNPELTREILEEHGLEIDEDGYKAELQRQQEVSRSNIKASDDAAWSENDRIITDLPKTEFLGYETLEAKGRALRIISGKDVVNEVKAGNRAAIILDRTPFYAESGGQASDIGAIKTATCAAKVINVAKSHDVFLHTLEVIEGALKFGDEVICTVEAVHRNKTARNHTATHLLHKALRLTLGDHVRQAGSGVDSQQLRFDFTHYEGLTDAQLSEVEHTVNRVIDEFRPVNTVIMTQSEAKENGAIALFDEKYGDTVRVVSVGDFSMELCGGTHVENSGQIGAFKITSEASVSSGTRRIEAITGSGVLAPFLQNKAIIADIANALKSRPENVTDRVNALLGEVQALKKEAAELKKASMADSLSDIIGSAEKLKKGLFITKVFEDLGADELRGICDDIRAREKDFIAALASSVNGKVIFIAAVSDSLQQVGYRAGEIVKAMAQAAGGGGGGKADMAQAGAKDYTKIPAAMDAAGAFVVQLQ
jgi:alanyl-tRNA synthetase